MQGATPFRIIPNGKGSKRGAICFQKFSENVGSSSISFYLGINPNGFNWAFLSRHGQDCVAEWMKEKYVDPYEATVILAHEGRMMGEAIHRKENTEQSFDTFPDLPA